MALHRRGALAVHGGLGGAALLDGKQGRAGLPVEHEDVAVLGELRDSVHRLAGARHRHEAGGGRQIPIPEVVLDHLVVPDPLARSRVEREDGIREQVIAVPVHAVPVERRRPGGREHHAVLLVHGDAGPRVGAARQRRAIGPRIRAELADLRNRVEGPPQLPRLHVERADVARRPWQRLGNAAAEDDEIVEDRPRRAGAHARTFDRQPEAFTKIDPARAAERLDRPARLAIERVEEVAIRDEDAILVNRDAAMAEPRARRIGRRQREASSVPGPWRHRLPPPSSTAWSRRPCRPRSPDGSASRRRGMHPWSRRSRPAEAV